MRKYKIKIEIIGRAASLFLLDGKGHIIERSSWIDNRDLAEKILIRFDRLLTKNNLSFSDIDSIRFDCDSPYFKKSRKRKSGESGLENENSKGKCGFTSWQIGEITAKILNYSLKGGKMPR
ncbi:MAG: hypothetical protein WA063_01820 [Minisyncoccia bacterium]